MQIFYNFLTFGATFSLSAPAGYGNAQKRLGIELVFLSNYDIIALPPAAGLSFPAGHHQDRGWQLRQPRRNSMKILALDIGGSFIKYAQFEDGVLAEPGAIPTQADQGRKPCCVPSGTWQISSRKNRQWESRLPARSTRWRGASPPLPRPSPALPGCRSKNCWNGIWASR